MSEHTPGPWTPFWFEENSRLQLGTWGLSHDGSRSVPIKRVHRINKTAEANARLIAAAPVLLAALKHAHEALAWHDGLAFEQDGKTADAVISNAIACATGGKP